MISMPTTRFSIVAFFFIVASIALSILMPGLVIAETGPDWNLSTYDYDSPAYSETVGHVDALGIASREPAIPDFRWPRITEKTLGHPSDLVAPNSLVGSVDDAFVYRGVATDHPGYADALDGSAYPRNPNGLTSADAHNGANGLADSPFTSWTHDPAVAALYAGPDGAILRIPTGAPGPSSPWKFEWSPDIHFESEVLVRGPVTGAVRFR